MRQPRKYKFGPDKSSLLGQVFMSCDTNVSSVEGNSNPGEAELSPTSDAASEWPTKESILSREVKVSKNNWRTA
ncbi:hypothetical protein TNCT_599551 [Trichonephila clavata]|uniref:Uncharacterized protein n=1 Tax=Trichonephila clavata TaxID=2740835 RepID=A0A8X6HMJ8_TRICU|nr:hypothetical protein TNCT_599551 [Trichonephila clavata]